MTQCCAVIVPGCPPSAAREAYKLRKQLVEPVFGIIKEQQGGTEVPAARPSLTWRPSGLCWPQPSTCALSVGCGAPAPFIGLFNGPEPHPVS